jgi:DNA helicase-2/ATP-dependent DNA helicase PcrA
MNLTDEQLRIINHSGGHARVSAVAGSGKTTTMVARVGQLLQQGVSANLVMVLMFNKSARDSFAEAMQNRLPSAAQLPEVRTFHSLGMRLVNSFTKRGALPPYSLVTEEYIQEKLARQVANEVYRESQDNDGWLAGDEVEEFITFIDRVKSTVTGPAEVFKKLDLSTRYSYFIKAFDLFEKVRRERKIRFYADLIHEPLMAMLADSELADWVTDRVDHIIVDEYQDINEAQQQLLKILAGSRARVMVVGDVDQCIYEWRGARPEYITTRFQLDFPKPENYMLSYTFRYGHQLSLAANHLISWN